MPYFLKFFIDDFSCVQMTEDGIGN